MSGSSNNNSKKNINKVEIRMYRLGTGDCFILKFFTGNRISFKMMIDGGVWNRKGSELIPYIEDLKDYVNNHVHVLVITHEHQDHVLAFQRCEELFTNDFQVDQIWMGWTENDADPMVKEWQEKFGEKKNALAMAAHFLAEEANTFDFQNQFKGQKFGKEMFALRQNFIGTIRHFADLNAGEVEQFNAKERIYKGGLRGMLVVKNQIADNNIRYFSPGDVIENFPNANGLKFYILGPPNVIETVRQEEGEEGETFEHSRNMESHQAFSEAVDNYKKGHLPSSVLPFDSSYILDEKKLKRDKDSVQIDFDNIKEVAQKMEQVSEKIRKTAYLHLIDNYRREDWRKIDYDWLYTSGAMALRMSSLTNNLSLAMAIEFEENCEVLLFPGDAEFGSWKSWHHIDWGNHAKPEGKHLTEDLLNRTIFYKVAHHASHNGTAKTLGLDMMTHPKLSAMATLDYNIISNGWKNTMPNRHILKDLLEKTRGRLIFMNEESISIDGNPIGEQIETARKNMDANEKELFDKNFETDEANGFYHQWTIRTKE